MKQDKINASKRRFLGLSAGIVAAAAKPDISRAHIQRIKENWISVMEGGAIGTAIDRENYEQDDRAAIQATIDHVKGLGKGGRVLIPEGGYAIGSPGLVVDQDNVFLLGAGGGSYRAAGIGEDNESSLRNSARTKLISTNANAPADLLTFTNINDEPCRVGGGASEIFLDGGIVSKRGLVVLSRSNGRFENLGGMNFLVDFISLGVNPHASVGNLGSQYNLISQCWYYGVASDSGNCRALRLWGIHSKNVDASGNEIRNCAFNCRDVAPVLLEMADNNSFYKVDSSTAFGGSTTHHFELGSSDQDSQEGQECARYNTFIQCFGNFWLRASQRGHESSTGNQILLNTAGGANMEGPNINLITVEAPARGALYPTYRADFDYGPYKQLNTFFHFTNEEDYTALRFLPGGPYTATLRGSSVTIAGAIPAGAILLGVTSIVTSRITGARGWKLGDGTIVDAYGSKLATAAGSATDCRDMPPGSITRFSSAGDIVITPIASNFTGGAIEVTPIYAMCTRSTSNSPVALGSPT